MWRSVPDGWLEYKPYGEVIKGTKILPFKVPLKETIVHKVKPEEKFTTSTIMQAFPQLKFVVDLTNTERYYDKTEFTNAGIKYTKIMVPGKKVPPLNCVIKFFETMDDFMAIAEEDDVIGVHCTHGINRTGYLICRYLIEKLGWESQDSLKAFEEARGYPIQREEYVTSLKKVLQEDDKGDYKTQTNRSLVSSRTVNARKENNNSTTTGRKGYDQYKLRVKHPKGRPSPYPMGGGPPPPPGFKLHRRGYANGAPYHHHHHHHHQPPHPPFGFGGPPLGFGSMPPPHPPGIPLPPPPPPPGGGGPPIYGPRPMRYGSHHHHHHHPLAPPPSGAMRGSPMPPPPPPGPGFHPPPPGYPGRLPPGPSRMYGPGPRLPPGSGGPHPGGPQSRLPPPKMPPPPPPPPPPPLPPQVRQAVGGSVSVKRLQQQQTTKKKQHIRNGMARSSSMRLARRDIVVSVSRRVRNLAVKVTKEQDFTADIFEENLLAVSSNNSRLRRSSSNRGRYSQTK